MEETGGPDENHRPVASHWQTLSYNVVSSQFNTCTYDHCILCDHGLNFGMSIQLNIYKFYYNNTVIQNWQILLFIINGKFIETYSTEIAF